MFVQNNSFLSYGKHSALNKLHNRGGCTLHTHASYMTRKYNLPDVNFMHRLLYIYVPMYVWWNETKPYNRNFLTILNFHVPQYFSHGICLHCTFLFRFKHYYCVYTTYWCKIQILPLVRQTYLLDICVYQYQYILCTTYIQAYNKVLFHSVMTRNT